MPACPECHRRISALTLIWVPPGRQFQCSHCHHWLQLDRDRASQTGFLMALGIVASIGLDRPHWFRWALIAGIVGLAAYVLFAKVEPIDEP